MEQQAREQAFITALTTEQFVLQAARSANIGEMIGRATVYMGTLSSTLIALGFLAQVATRLDPFIAAVLPAVFLLGEFTFIALLRNTMESLVLLQKMQRIRGYYRTLVPEAEQFFGPAEEDERFTAALATVGLRAWPAGMLFTGASVIAAVNSIVGGVGSALLAAKVAGLGVTAALPVGIVVAVVLIGLFFFAFKYSSWGVAMRAAAEDGEAAALMGIPLGRVSMTTWVVAGALTAVAALFLVGSPTPGVSPAVYTVALSAFPAAILGGLDSTGGALAGGLLIGLSESLAAGYQDQLAFLGRGFSAVVPYVVMIIVLLVRPSGLFGTRELTRV